MHKFTHKDEEFEIMVGLKNQTDSYIQVVRTSDGKPVNKRTYTVTSETRMDMKTMINMDAVKEMMKIAKSDIINDIESMLRSKAKEIPRSLNSNGEIDWQ